MDRIPEPELMDDPARARAYARADFSEPHEAFVGYFQERFPQWRPRRVLDLGCGPADVTIRFARAYPECEIGGVGGAEAMLALGREALERAGLSGRVRLVRRRLPAAGWDERFDTAISNSLLHHLHDPMVLWGTVAACAPPGAAGCVIHLLPPHPPHPPAPRPPRAGRGGGGGAGGPRRAGGGALLSRPPGGRGPAGGSEALVAQ